MNNDLGLDNKGMRNLLMSKQKVIFNLKGSTKRMATSPSTEDCPVDAMWDGYNGMNVNKFGPTCVTLYTYDMLGRKSIGKIKYSDIEIIEIINITDIKQSDDKKA